MRTTDPAAPQALPGKLGALGRLCRRFRLPLLVLSALLTVAAGLIAPSLPMGADVTEFLPPDDPAVVSWLELSRSFGAFDILIVGLEEPGRPFQPESLARLDRITKALAGARGEGLAWVRSLANLEAIRLDQEGTIQSDLLLNAIPQDESQRAQMMARVQADPQAVGSFVSRDLSAYVILVRLAPGADGRRLAELVRNTVEEGRGELAAAYFGAPFIENTITTRIYRQLPIIAGLFVVLLLIPLLLLGRRLPTALLALGGAGVALVWWLGLLQLVGTELTATASGAALVLLALATLLNARLLAAPGRPGSGRILLLALAGALSLLLPALTAIPFLASFAQAAAPGLAVAVTSAVLLVMPLATWLPTPAAGEPPLRSLVPGPTLAMVVLLLAGGGYAASQARFLMSPRELFAPDDEVGRSIAFFDRHLGGADLLQIGLAGDFRKPGNCARVMRLTDLLQGDDLFADVRSHAQILAMLAENFGGSYRIPAGPQALNNLWFFLEGSPDIRPLVNEERNRAMVAARIAPRQELAISRWLEAAREAVADSALSGVAGARLRLAALAMGPGRRLDPATIDRLLEGLREPTAERQQELSRAILAELAAFVRSDQSPFEPTDEEWRVLEELLARQAPAQEVATAIDRMESYREFEYPPEVAGELAANLKNRLERGIRAQRVDEAMAHLGPTIGSLPDTGPFMARVRGILEELIDPESVWQDDLEVTVSGFPAVISQVAERLTGSIWLAAAMIWTALVLSLLLSGVGGRVALAVALEALLASVLTFGLGHLARLEVDSASAVIYLLPPLAAVLASPRLGVDPGGHRLETALLVALAAAALALLAAGILPVFRIGAVMAIALVLVAAVGALSRRLRAR